MKISIGVDPGRSGAIAFLPEKGDPWTVKNTETLTDLFEALNEASFEDAFAVLEVVHSMPGQGVASSFKFGQSYGQLEAILTCSGIPFERVSPQKWQGTLGCRTKGDKNITKQKAQELFPQVKVNHAIADALLLAVYAQRLRVGS